jgi:hypothetical protein
MGKSTKYAIDFSSRLRADASQVNQAQGIERLARGNLEESVDLMVLRTA